jgi:hypothetical protein
MTRKGKWDLCGEERHYDYISPLGGDTGLSLDFIPLKKGKFFWKIASNLARQLLYVFRMSCLFYQFKIQ